MAEPTAAATGQPEAGATRPVRSGVSVRVRILATLLLVTVLGMVAAGATAYFVQRERTLSGVDTHLAGLVDDARLVAAEPTAGATLTAVLTTMVQRLRPSTNESTLAIVDGRAALSPGGQVDFLLDRNTALIDRVVAEAAAGGVVRGTLDDSGRALRYVAIPVSVGGDPVSGLFVAAVDLNAELRGLNDAFRTYAVVAAIALVAIGVVGWFVAGRLLRPIRVLTGTTRRIGASDLSERIPVAGHDDVSELTATVNGMLDRLESALLSQRRLLDDVGHELKTPLTIVRGHLELMDTSDPGDVAASRDLVIDEIDRMSGLVGDITLLASAGEPVTLAPEPTDVAELTERIHAKAAALAERDWALTGTAAVVARLDAEKVTQAVLQLAANAVSHGSADASARIELGSAVDGPSLLFWVQDSGPGIEPAMQARIFERFQRGAESDSPRGTHGSGLGLAIVSTIAAAHGGRVSVHSVPGEGARFTLAIPLENGERPA